MKNFFSLLQFGFVLAVVTCYSMNINAQRSIEEVNAIKEKYQSELQYIQSMKDEYQRKKDEFERVSSTMNEYQKEVTIKTLNEMQQKIEAYEAEIKTLIGKYDYLDVNGYKYKIPDNQEWEWLQSMSRYADEGELEHVEKTFPVKEDYYTSAKYPDYKLHIMEFSFGGKGWYVCDKDGKLIGAQYCRYERDSVIKADMIYEFGKNAYNIQAEKQDVQKWASYLIYKYGNHKADLRDWAMFGVISGEGVVLDEAFRIRNLYAKGRISRLEYNKRLEELKKKAKRVNQIENKLSKSLPSKEDQNRASDYVKQLESDAKSKYDYRSLIAERLNGTQIQLTTEDKKVRILITYYLEDNNRFNWVYNILEKEQ